MANIYVLFNLTGSNGPFLVLLTIVICRNEEAIFALIWTINARITSSFRL